MGEKKILFVDDDDAIQTIMRQTLEMEGYRVVSATNGQKALDILAEDKDFCLIILDLMMPIMNGWQFLEHFVNSQELRQIPVIILSAFSREEMPRKSVIAALKKPVDIESLLDQLVKHCI